MPKALIALFLCIIASIVTLNLDMEFIDHDIVKLDIVLETVFVILLILTKKNFKESTGRITKFLKKNYLKFIMFIILAVNTANLVCNATYSMDIIRNEASTVEQFTYATIINLYDRIIDSLKNYDEGLYRTLNNGEITSNDALTFGYNGLSYSSSTYSKSLHLFLEKFGLSQYHVKVYYEKTTKVVDMIFGIKYFISIPGRVTYKDYELAYEEKYIETNSKIYINPYSLSLGYAVNKNIFNTNLENNNTFELQNELLQNMTNLDEKVYKQHEGNITETKLTFKEDETEYTNVTYEFEAESADNIYIYLFGDSDEKLKIYINGEEQPVVSKIENNKLIDIGKRNAGEKIRVEIQSEGEINIENMYLYYEDEEALSKHYEVLSAGQVNLEKVNNHKYQGTINVSNDEQYIMFTIPYDEGWEITVDGEKVEVEPVLGELISIKVDSGEHEICLEYRINGIETGLILTFAGIVLFLIILIKSKKVKNK